MEIHGPIRAAVTPQPTETRPSAAQQDAIKTDLRPTQAVPAIGDGERAGIESRLTYRGEDRENRGKTSRKYDFDSETRDLIYKALDTSTGDVVWQLPAESMVRLRQQLERAYSDEPQTQIVRQA